MLCYTWEINIFIFLYYIYNQQGHFFWVLRFQRLLWYFLCLYFLCHIPCHINKSLNYVRRNDLEFHKLENILIEIFIKKSKSVVIACHYKPPNSSKYLTKDHNELFDNALLRYCSEDKETIILGDINTDFQKQSDNKEIKMLLKQYGLTQL